MTHKQQIRLRMLVIAVLLAWQVMAVLVNSKLMTIILTIYIGIVCMAIGVLIERGRR